MLSLGKGVMWKAAHTDVPIPNTGLVQGSDQSTLNLSVYFQPRQDSFPGGDITVGDGSQVQRPALLFLFDFAISEDHSAKATGAGTAPLRCLLTVLLALSRTPLARVFMFSDTQTHTFTCSPPTPSPCLSWNQYPSQEKQYSIRVLKEWSEGVGR